MRWRVFSGLIFHVLSTNAQDHQLHVSSDQSEYLLEIGEEQKETFFNPQFNMRDTNANNWAKFNILSREDIHFIQKHFRKHGPFHSKFEILAVENLGNLQKRFILKALDLEQKKYIPIRTVIQKKNSSSELAYTFNSKWPQAYGYLREDSLKFIGKHYSSYARVRVRFLPLVEFGAVFKKDPGEKVKIGGIPGSTLMRAYTVYTNGGLLRKMILGAYNATYGNGLVYGGVFSASAGLNLQIQNGFKANRSVSEQRGVNGVALRLHHKGVDLDLIASHTNKSVNRDSLLQYFSSFHGSGLYRTPAELSKKRTLKESRLGFVLSGRSLGFVYRFQDLSLPWTPDANIWNAKKFSGSKLHQISLMYHVFLNEWYLKGELAIDSRGAYASDQQLRIHPDKNIVMRIEHKFQHPAWLMSNKKQEFSLFFNWKESRYVSWSGFWNWQQNIWLPYLKRELEYSEKFWINVNYKQRKRRNASMQYLLYKKSAGSTKSSLRLNYQAFESNVFRWTNRAEWNRIHHTSESRAFDGHLFYTDFRFSLRKMGMTLYYRYTGFNMASYENRISTYENNVLYAYSLTSLHNTGGRNSLLLVYKPRPTIRMSVKFALTQFDSNISTGSGNDQRSGDHITEFVFQLQLKL
jgi:hypothetical protein